MSTKNTVSVPSHGVPSATLAKANTKAPIGKGGELGGRTPGFGSGKPDPSTVNALGGALSKAPPASGSGSARGFKSPLIPGKIS